MPATSPSSASRCHPGDPEGGACRRNLAWCTALHACPTTSSVLDNMMLGSEPLWQPLTRRRAGRQKLQAVAQRFGLGVDPEALVGRLLGGERQRVEILKALYRGARILILDEPTAVLTPQESEALFAVLGRWWPRPVHDLHQPQASRGAAGVAGAFAVLRAGRLVAEASAANASQAQLALWDGWSARGRRHRNAARRKP